MHTKRGSAPLRLMTYNIHWWSGRDRRLDVARLAAVIRSVGADIVGLNEVLHPVTMRGKLHTPLSELADRLEMYHVFGPSGWVEERAPGWRGPIGNALLSRYPLTAETNTNLPRLLGSQPRSLLSATLASGPAAGLTAFVTHLDHAFEGTRLLQLREVLRIIARRDPHFLIGDFNTPGFLGPRSRRLLPPVLRMLQQAGYLDAFSKVGRGPGHTFPAHSPLVRIDFLFLPQRWAHGLRSAHTINDTWVREVSDHRPLWVEWAWPERAELRAA